METIIHSRIISLNLFYNLGLHFLGPLRGEVSFNLLLFLLLDRILMMVKVISLDWLWFLGFELRWPLLSWLWNTFIALFSFSTLTVYQISRQVWAEELRLFLWRLLLFLIAKLTTLRAGPSYLPNSLAASLFATGWRAVEATLGAVLEPVPLGGVCDLAMAEAANSAGLVPNGLLGLLD